MNVMEFYPSKFCLITDVLDTFGKLVYTRLLEKSASSSGKIRNRKSVKNLVLTQSFSFIYFSRSNHSGFSS